MPSLKTLLKRKGLTPPTGFVDCRANYRHPRRIGGREAMRPVEMTPLMIEHCSMTFLRCCNAGTVPGHFLRDAITTMLAELKNRVEQEAKP